MQLLESVLLGRLLDRSKGLLPRLRLAMLEELPSPLRCLDSLVELMYLARRLARLMLGLTVWI